MKAALSSFAPIGELLHLAIAESKVEDLQVGGQVLCARALRGDGGVALQDPTEPDDVGRGQTA